MLVFWVTKTTLFHLFRNLCNRWVGGSERVAFENGFRCRTAFQEMPVLEDKFCLSVSNHLEAGILSSLPHFCLNPIISLCTCFFTLPSSSRARCMFRTLCSGAWEVCVSGRGICKVSPEPMFVFMSWNLKLVQVILKVFDNDSKHCGGCYDACYKY